MKKNICGLFCLLIMILVCTASVQAAENSEPESQPEAVLLENFDPYEDPEPIVVRFFQQIWDEGEETDLAYVNPQRWGRTYSEEGSDKIVVECGGYLMEVTPQGEKGPVWMYTDYYPCGELIGVTANTFVFQEEDRWMAVYWGDFYEERRVLFEELLEQEQKTFRPVY